MQRRCIGKEREAKGPNAVGNLHPRVQIKQYSYTSLLESVVKLAAFYDKRVYIDFMPKDSE
ncbi:MAG: hypothetical protein IJ482_06470 [Alphaproteobacteria bacterium]|nr:hypothetical protein [Alphaproteobacteria bacterium]